MKLTGKIGWVSMNSVSKKLPEFDSNVFHHFKDYFFKVLATDVIANGLPLMFNRYESRLMFYWQSDPTRFKSFDEDLLTFVERVDKAILEQLSASLDVWAVLSLPLASNPFTALDGKCFTLSSSFYVRTALWLELTFVVLLLLILHVSCATLLGGPL